MIRIGEIIAAIGAIILFLGITWCVAMASAPIWFPFLGLPPLILGLDIMADGGEI